MNDAIHTRLRVIVERAVRPVRASEARKRAMREELLSHVTAVFEEEAARPGGDEAALARTAERFGNPAALAAQLEASAPWFDPVERWVDSLWFSAGESTLLRAARLTALCELFSLGMIGFVWNEINASWRLDTLWPFGWAMVAIALFVTSFTFLSSAIRELLRDASPAAWLRAATVFAASSLAIYGWVLLIGNRLDDLLAVAWSMACITAVAYVTARTCDARFREHEEWAGLELG
jgi:hypothetical protein